jgi:copper chaperone CopZ
MKKLVLTVPTLYADHHASAVRDILENTKGVAKIFISSAYHQIELEYDPKKVNEEAIKKALSNEGYEANGGALAFHAGQTTIGDRSTRHTGAHTGVGDTLSFGAKQVSFEGRPLWPCPGFISPSEMEK